MSKAQDDVQETSGQVSQQPWQQLAQEIDLPLPTAVWVLFAHLVTILSPLVIIVVVLRHQQPLEIMLFSTELMLASAALMIAGSIFESAQNTFDRWYLTRIEPSFCDFLFHSLINLSLAAIALACLGQYLWLWAIMGVCCLGFALCYLKGWNDAPMRTPISLLSAGAFYWIFGDPIIFLQFLMVFLTIYFFGLLLKTHCQALHGFTTIVNGFTALFIALGIGNAVDGNPTPWWLVIAVVVITVALALLIKPKLAALSATPRKRGAVT